MPQTQNVRFDAVENGNEIVFLYSVKQGPASRSYGLAVALLAGLPPDVIERARAHLRTIEDKSLHPKYDAENDQISLFNNDLSQIKSVLDATNPDELSPKEALDLVYHLCALKKSRVH